MTWWQKWWKWVVAGLAIVGVFLAGFFSRRPKILTPSSDAEDKKRELEAEAEEAKKEAEIVRDETIKQIEDKRKEDIKKFEEEQEANVEKYQDDPQMLSDWLKQIGNKNR